jgi:hypothetical protein
MEANLMYFPQKTGSIFPDQGPPLFFDRIALPALPVDPDNLQISRFFTLIETPLNAPVFFRLKRPVSKNTRLKR